MTGRKTSTATTTEHFLPDFCHSTFIFRLLLTAELIAFILFIIMMSTEKQPHWHWTSFGLLSLFIQWITLCSAATLCLLRTWLIRLPTTLSTLLALLIILTIIVATSIGAYHTHVLPSSLMPSNSLSLILSRNIIIGMIITGFFLRYTYVQHQLAQQQKAELQARLQSLQSRIQPHFLFNTLNNIASLIPSDPSLAEKLTEDLSTLLRASLSESTFQVPLSKEINLAKRYLHLEKLRLNERLITFWTLPTIQMETIHVPHLILQPLLENAIKHGIQPAIEGGTLRIIVECHHSHISITIQNTLPSAHTSTKDGCRMGLTNVRERLKALYDHQGFMNINETPTHYHVSLRIPI